MRPALPLLILIGVGIGCGESGPQPDAPGDPSSRAAPGTLAVLDADGNTLRLAESPTRIVSLVPAVSRILIDLGATDRIVGRTRYDTAVALADVPSVGGGLGPELETLLAVEPDLVVRFGGPTDTETPERLDRLGIPHLAVRPDRIQDVRRIHLMLGELTGETVRAAELVAGLDATLDSVAAAVRGLPTRNVSYLLGADPPWAAGPETYIGELIALAGGRLRPDELPPLYATISPEALVVADLDVILISGGDSLDPRIAEGRRVESVPEWVEVPGPDLRRAAWVIARAIHPELRSPEGR